MIASPEKSDSVVLKAFIVDDCQKETTKTYWLKGTQGPIIVTPEEYDPAPDGEDDEAKDAQRAAAVVLDSKFFQGLDMLLPSDPQPTQWVAKEGFSVSQDGSVMRIDSGVGPCSAHILQANILLRKRGHRPDLVLISPYELATAVSNEPDVFRVDGSILGNAVAWSPCMYLDKEPSSYVVYVVDSNDFFRLVHGDPIEEGGKPRRSLFYRDLRAAVKLVYSNHVSGIQ